MALWLLRTQALYQPYAIWRRMERPDWPIGGFARLGVPGGLAIMVEVTSFTLMALFIARQGTLASAATRSRPTWRRSVHGAAVDGHPTSARVSYWLGRATRARAGDRTGFKMGMLLSVGLSRRR